MSAKRLWTKPVVLAALTAALLPLAACQNGFEGVRQSFRDMNLPSFSQGAAKNQTGQKTQDVMSMDGITACPEARIVQDLGAIHEFTDMSRPSERTRVSSASMTIDRVSCVYSKEHQSVAVQVKLVIDSELGPRAKIYKGDKPNFTYPYFLAVTNPENDIVAKEVFAASVSYRSDQDAVRHTETLRQIISLDDFRSGPDYAILVGFQLDEDQLGYNRRLLEPSSTQAQTQPSAQTGNAEATYNQQSPLGSRLREEGRKQQEPAF